MCQVSVINSQENSGTAAFSQNFSVPFYFIQRDFEVGFMGRTGAIPGTHSLGHWKSAVFSRNIFGEASIDRATTDSP